MALANELQSVFDKQIGSVLDFLHRDASARSSHVRILILLPFVGDDILKTLHLAVTDKEFRIEVVSVPHVDVAEKVIEADVIGIRQIVRSSDAPLADAGRPIASFLQHRGDSCLPRLNNDRSDRVASHNSSSHVPPGQQHASRRSTHRAARVKLSEADSFLRHRIDPRCLEHLLAKAAQISVAKIVGEDQHNVRLPASGF